MLRDAIFRLVAGGLLTLAVLVGALFILPVVLFGRREYLGSIGSGSSCLLNALCGGPRTVTFSAWSYVLLLRGRRDGTWRVRFVDALPFNGEGHCQDAYLDHYRRGLLQAIVEPT